jgi:sensor histidine kinase YesM
MHKEKIEMSDEEFREMYQAVHSIVRLITANCKDKATIFEHDFDKLDSILAALQLRFDE